MHSSSLKRTVASTIGSLFVLSLLLTSGFSLTTEQTKAIHTECSDGLDNDGDRKVDYPQDDDCESLDDDYEGISHTGNFVTVTDGKEEVQQSGALVYVITLKQQRVTSRNVNIDFHIPHQGNIVSASDGGSVSDHDVRWTNVSVYKNVTRTLQVHVNVRPDAALGQYIIGRVRVDGEEATDTTLISEVKQKSTIDYSVSVSDGKEYVQPGEELTYSVRVRNTGDEMMTSDVRLNMPSSIYFISASDGGIQQSYTVVWPQLQFEPGVTRVLSAKVQVDPRAHNRISILARANVGGASDTDHTTINIGVPKKMITATITDNKETAKVGEVVTYQIKVHNSHESLVATNVAVDAGLPQYGQFSSATDGGYYDGTNVRWLILQLAPGENRLIQFSAKVRPDAPEGAVLLASAVADGANGVIDRDTTTVSRFGSNNNAQPLFRKTADRGEVFPGGSIRYTLTVHNTLDHAINDATITDRFDSEYLSLESLDSPSDLISQDGGQMVWRVPSLAPGELWRTSYILKVSNDLPAGLALNNIATIQGSDIREVSLTERVMTVGAQVMMRETPRTGAGLDALMVLALAAVGVLSTRLQKKHLA
jgi:uncharacterized repeat protein (TIGR01451 family)